MSSLEPKKCNQVERFWLKLILNGCKHDEGTLGEHKLFSDIECA